MAALKQQHHSDPAADKTGNYWRKLALVLALLLALLTGAVAAYLLTPLLRPAPPATSQSTTEPAKADVILQALQTKDAAENISAQSANTTASTSPTQIGTALGQVVSPPPQPVSEQFSSPPPVKTMTAGSAAAEPQPLAVTKEVAVEPEPVEVSSELRDKFASALKATEQSNRSPAKRANDAPAIDISELDPGVRQQIPALRFDAHVYATTASQRWVKVNGKTLQEGQWVTADIRIKEITPQFVLLQYGSQLFSMAALSAWPD